MLLVALLAVVVPFAAFNLGGTNPGTGLSAATPVQKAPLAGTGRPSVMITGRKPIEVTGRSFKPRELVVVNANGKRKSVTAGLRGGFVVRFAGQSTCDGATIVAVGSKGSRASVNFSQLLCLEREG